MFDWVLLLPIWRGVNGISVMFCECFVIVCYVSSSPSAGWLDTLAFSASHRDNNHRPVSRCDVRFAQVEYLHIGEMCLRKTNNNRNAQPIVAATRCAVDSELVLFLYERTYVGWCDQIRYIFSFMWLCWFFELSYRLNGFVQSTHYMVSWFLLFVRIYIWFMRNSWLFVFG